MKYTRLYPLIPAILLLTTLWQWSISPLQAGVRSPSPSSETYYFAKPLLTSPCQFIYPIIIHESQVPTTSGTLIPDILYGATDHGASGSLNDKGFLAWDPNETLSTATLEEEFRSPELSVTNYQNAINPSDIELSVGDYVRSLPGNNGGVNDSSDPLLDNLVGQDIIIPVWDTFSEAQSAYHISGFVQVRITAEAPVGINLTGSNPFIMATYLGPVDLTECPILTIIKQGPLTATTGSLVTYTLTVTNNGTVTATNLLITDTLPIGANYVEGGSLTGDVISWTVSSLAGNQHLSRTFTITAGQTVTNSLYGVRPQAYFTGTEPYSATGQVSVVTVVEPPVVEPSSTLAITKRGPVTATAGSLITYTITVTNSGNSTATNLVITDALPIGASYVSGGSLTGEVISWTIPSLANGQNLTRTFTVTASQTITNYLYQISANNAVSATGQIDVVTIVEPPVVVEPTPLLTITKRGPVTATAGSLMTYTLIVTNSGDLAATNLVITDALPAGANYAGGGSLVGNVVSWTVTSLANGQSLTRTFSVTASQTITNHHYRVSATEGISATGQVRVVTVVNQKKLSWLYLPIIMK
jgi:uncharacterized repeat protein (TIGR01451 family)